MNRQAGVGGQARDVGAFDHDHGALGRQCQGGTAAAQRNAPACLHAVGRGDLDRAAVVQRLNQAPRVQLQAVGAGIGQVSWREIGIGLLCITWRASDLHADALKPFDPTADQSLLAHIEHHLSGIQARIGATIGVLHVLRLHPHLARLQADHIRRRLHVTLNVDLIRRQRDVVTERGNTGVQTAGVARLLHQVGVFGVT